MRKRFAWAKNLPKPDNDAAPAPVHTALAPVQPEPVTLPVQQVTPAPEPAPASKPRERLLDRRDGRARPASEYVEGQIRGGKRSNQWGRSNSELARGDWVGVRLPPGYNAKVKQMAAAHNLYVWQILTEGVDLFEATHGATPRHSKKP